MVSFSWNFRYILIQWEAGSDQGKTNNNLPPTDASFEASCANGSSAWSFLRKQRSIRSFCASTVVPLDTGRFRPFLVSFGPVPPILPVQPLTCSRYYWLDRILEPWFEVCRVSWVRCFFNLCPLAKQKKNQFES